MIRQSHDDLEECWFDTSNPCSPVFAFPPPFEPDSSILLQVDGGLFMLHLGDPSLPNMQDMDWRALDAAGASLRIWFSEDDVTFTQLSPDQPFGSVGYAIKAARVPNEAIGEAQLAPNAVTVFKIANGAVNNVKLAVNSVTGDKVVNGTITSNTLDTDGVALAAIQALYEENQALKARLERLEAALGAISH